MGCGGKEGKGGVWRERKRCFSVGDSYLSNRFDGQHYQITCVCLCVRSTETLVHLMNEKGC